MSAQPQSALFGPVDIEREELADGAFVLRSRVALQPYPDNLCVHLKHWAEKEPERIFLAERDTAGGWRELSYAQAHDHARAIAQSLLDRGTGTPRPVMLLSDNAIDNGLMQLGAMYAGVPAVPVSPAYSLMSQDHAKLKHIFNQVKPALVYTADAMQFAKALDALDLNGVELVVSRPPSPDHPATAFSDLVATKPTAAVDAALAQVTPDSVAKILFTSGSTGLPKGVINTHRMMCSNQQAIAQVWPFIETKPPVIVDWLPWHHTFGGNHNFNMVLRNGGTMYIDTGKPAPGLVEKTIANLREIAPTLYFNVPRGFDMVIPYLEQDAALRDHFFSNLDVIFYAAAALPQNLWERLEKLSLAARGSKVTMTSAWGSTETAPLVTSVHFPIDRAGVIGVPAPGCELKMVPNAGKLEMRVRGPNITPGYLNNEELTRAAFDEDGFYCIGDAGKLADTGDPNAGIIFDGRVAEDFKLMTGTWVNVGELRVSAVSAGAPIVQDAVIAGHDRDEIGLLIFPNLPACAKLAGLDPSEPASSIVQHEAVRAALRQGLGAYNANHTASSARIARALIMSMPPSIDANEITDKGYINQRAALDARADLVAKLFSDHADVIVL